MAMTPQDVYSGRSQAEIILPSTWFDPRACMYKNGTNDVHDGYAGNCLAHSPASQTSEPRPIDIDDLGGGYRKIMLA